MGVFKSKEEKEAQKAAEREAMTKVLLAKYGLESLTDPADIEAIKNISLELSGTGAMEFGSMLAGSEKDWLQLQTYYMRAIMDQNFLIIRLLSQIRDRQ